VTVSRVGTVLVAAGASERVGAIFPKQFLPLGPDPMFFLALESVLPHSDEVAIVTLPDFVGTVRAILRAAGATPDLIFRNTNIVAVTGGERRQDSVERGLEALSDEVGVILVHDAARPFASPDLTERVIAAAREHGAAVPVVPPADTVKRVRAGAVVETMDRSSLGLAQTPQGFRREIIERAYRELAGADITDDARAVELLGLPVATIPGESGNFKVTTPVDLQLASVVANCRRGLGPGYRAGTGSDTHRLVEGRDLVLCGVKIPFEKGLDGHSDADAATHAVCDALLGAVAEGDIGVHFPPDDPEYKDISSLLLLKKVAGIVREKNCRVVNVDVTIVAEAPRLAPHVAEMRQSLADALDVDVHAVSVKATTTEGTGPEGEGVAISSTAVAVVTERPLPGQARTERARTEQAR
jgi:2-C-methyl-D-erythritol 4-phosphate cytidylyltransferase/2-C-methyl-D-erythritol 2,4-cyclodiphosphate synthase